MKKNVGFYYVYCGSATFEYDGLVMNGNSGDVNANEAEQGGEIQGLKADGVGGVGQNIED